MDLAPVCDLNRCFVEPQNAECKMQNCLLVNIIVHIYFIAISSALVQVFVANHTSMIDFIILEQMTAFAVIMQKHPGWVGKKGQASFFQYFLII